MISWRKSLPIVELEPDAWRRFERAVDRGGEKPASASSSEEEKGADEKAPTEGKEKANLIPRAKALLIGVL